MRQPFFSLSPRHRIDGTVFPLLWRTLLPYTNYPRHPSPFFPSLLILRDNLVHEVRRAFFPFARG